MTSAPTDEGELALWELARNFSRWFFDLLRNFVLVGGLKYFYEKSGSAGLFWLREFALVVIVDPRQSALTSATD